MRITRVCGAAVLAAASLMSSVVGSGGAQAQPRCATVTTSQVIASPGPTGWAENLVVDGAGAIWVSRSLMNVVTRYDATGTATASVAVNAPGSIRPGPDGDLYVASGDSTLNMIPGMPLSGTVVRIDPAAPQAKPRVFARGFGMPNGLAFDTLGNLYLADGVLGMVRLRPDGSRDPSWSAAAPKDLSPASVVNGIGMNGAAVLGESLFVTLTSSMTGRVLRVATSSPPATSVAADLTAPLPGVLDDLIALDDHTLAVASTTGVLHLVDLRGGQRCSATVGVPLTALAQVPGDAATLLASSETGQILRLRLS